MDLFVKPGVVIPERELEWSAVRSSGPGGQNVNKVASKVELRFDFEETSTLTSAAKARLRALAKNKLDTEGRLLIVSQLTRNQPQNLQDARERLSALVAQALVVPKRRRPTKPSLASKRRRAKDKRQNSLKKQGRTKKNHDD